MQQQPKHISFAEVNEIISETPEYSTEHPFVSNELVVVNSSDFLFNSFLHMDVPYIIEDVRMLMVLEGEADVTVNLIDRHIQKRTIMFLGYGTIMQPRKVSPDIKLCGFMMKKGLAERVIHNHLTHVHLAEDITRTCLIEEQEMYMLRTMHTLLWQIVTTYGYREDIVLPSLMLFSNHFVSLMEEGRQRNAGSTAHTKTMFRRFISLINKHCAEEHNLPYYADKLCVTPHHLGLLVKAESGVTAKEWIERVLTTKAKVLLKGSDMQATEVSAQLGFANPSFFSKYFKRITGMTPQEYKQS